MQEPNLYDEEDAWLDEPFLARERRKRWLILAAVVAGVFLVLAAVFARPTYRYFKDWRAENLANQALALVEQSPPDYQQAYELATAAYALAPNQIQAMRAIATIYTKANPANAFVFWQAVLENSMHTIEDRVHYTQVAFQLRKRDLVASQIAWFHENDPEFLDGKILRIHWLISEGLLPHAIELAKSVYDDPDNKSEHRMLYVQLCLRSNDPILRESGLNALTALIEGYDSVALYASRLVARNTQMPRRLVDRALLKLRNHPEATLNDKFDSYGMLYLLGDIDEDALYKNAEALLNPQELGDLVDYVQWLNQQRFYERTLAILDTNRVLERRDLFVPYLNALANAGRWDEFYGILSKDRIPLENYLQNLYWTHYYKVMDEPKNVEYHWKKMILEIETKSRGGAHKLWQVEAYAKLMGWNQLREELISRLLKLPSEQRRAYEQTIQIQKSKNSLEGMLEVYRRMLEIYPNDPAVINDYAYLRLLANIEVEEASADVQRLLDENSKYLAYHITQALSYLRKEQPQEALKVLQGVSVDWLSVHTQYQCIAAAVLLSLGDEENRAKAQQLLAKINPSVLLSEERKLISDAQGDETSLSDQGVDTLER